VPATIPRIAILTNSPPRPRTADPYRDLDVVDARAPRVNQATVGILSALAVATGWWPILAVLALQFAIGLRFGRRYCVPCLLYFEVIQPRFGEGPLEDARPPRLANRIGFAVLATASIAYTTGFVVLGAALGVLVASLALLAATTGLCVGCQVYRVAAQLRGIRVRPVRRIEAADLGVPSFGTGASVVFSHPLCTDCGHLVKALGRSTDSVVVIDVRARPDLARKYGVVLVPTLARVLQDGAVTRWTVGAKA
jgi:hypothetical protein